MRKRTILYAGLPFSIALGFLIARGLVAFDFGQVFRGNPEPQANENSETLPGQEWVAGSEGKFAYLSKQKSSFCGLQPEAVDDLSADRRLQGSCCTPMDLHRYQEQVQALKKYSNLPQVPEDPYDVSVALAQELLGYGRTIVLTEEQQETYDRAMQLSDEGGPCCCPCWRWYAFEGQAKYLITGQGWTAGPIADLWELEDGCGGDDHVHGS